MNINRGGQHVEFLAFVIVATVLIPIIITVFCEEPISLGGGDDEFKRSFDKGSNACFTDFEDRPWIQTISKEKRVP